MSFLHKLKPSATGLVIGLIAIYWVVFSFRFQVWEKNQVKDDVINYYAYLPATVIYHDVSLKFAVGNNYFGDKIWLTPAPNGNSYIKMSMGMSVMYSPFFFIAHLQTILSSEAPTGYSRTYQDWLIIGAGIYLLIGLFFLRKVLLRFFSEGVSALVLFLIFFATNLSWYSAGEPLMPHVYLFSLVSVLLYLSIRWHETPTAKFSILLGLVMGLIILIRPIHAMLVLVPLLYNVESWQGFKAKLVFLKSKILQMGIISLCIFLAGLPQLIYWKYITGNWFFYSYGDEHFYWNNPHILDGLLSFRKGWLIYTPVMFLALAGFFWLAKYLKSFRTVLLVVFPLFVYITYSWWCWWYGGTFGQRSMIDIYPLLALAMGAFFKHVSTKRVIVWAGAALFPLLVALNHFQIWQFSEGLIHFDSMTKRSYFIGFFQTDFQRDWSYNLVAPDIAKAKSGYPEKHQKEDYYFKKISLQGGDSLRYVSSEINRAGELTLNRWDPNDWEQFLVSPVDGKKISLKAANGRFVTTDLNRDSVLHADRDNAWEWEQFELICLDDRKAVLKAFNGCYVRLQDKKTPAYLAATVLSVDSATVFKLQLIKEPK